MKRKSLSFIAAMLVVATAVLVSTGSRATTPPGWKVLVDKTKNCQISVPGDWVVSSFSPSSAESPDKKANVAMHGTNQGQTLDQAKTGMKGMYPPLKVIEDSKTRLFYSFKTPRAAEDSTELNYYAGIPVKGNVCGAQITFKIPSLEPVARQIAESLAAAK